MRMGLCMCVVFVLVMLLSFNYKLIVSHFDTMPCIEVFIALFLICIYYIEGNEMPGTQ